jgi:hypothetical protein
VNEQESLSARICRPRPGSSLARSEPAAAAAAAAAATRCWHAEGEGGGAGEEDALGRTRRSRKSDREGNGTGVGWVGSGSGGCDSGMGGFDAGNLKGGIMGTRRRSARAGFIAAVAAGGGGEGVGDVSTRRKGRYEPVQDSNDPGRARARGGAERTATPRRVEQAAAPPTARPTRRQPHVRGAARPAQDVSATAIATATAAAADSDDDDCGGGGGAVYLATDVRVDWGDDDAVGGSGGGDDDEDLAECSIFCGGEW